MKSFTVKIVFYWFCLFSCAESLVQYNEMETSYINGTAAKLKIKELTRKTTLERAMEHIQKNIKTGVYKVQNGNLITSDLYNNDAISPECSWAMIGMHAKASTPNWPPNFGEIMVDADGLSHPPVGQTMGNNAWLGMMETCIWVKATGEIFEVEITPGVKIPFEHDFNGRYARVYWFFGYYFSGGICVPDVCSRRDITLMYTDPNNPDVGPFKVYINDLDQEDFSSDATAIATTVVLSIFGVVILAGTILDFIHQKKKNKCEADLKQGVDNKAFVKDTKQVSHANGTIGHGTITQNGVVVSEKAIENTYEEINGVTPPNGDVPAPSQNGYIHTSAQTNGEVPHSKIHQNGDVHSATQNGNIKTPPQYEEVEMKKFSQPAAEEMTYQSLVEPPKQNVFVRCLVCFSLYSNIPNIMNTRTDVGYGCMHGVRFLSMMYIILGHTWDLGILVVQDAITIINENTLWFQFKIKERHVHSIINNMNLAVESFFVLSASLTVVSFMKAMKRQGDRPTFKQLGLYLFHRYWRLTPVFGFIMMINAAYFPYLGGGKSVQSPRDLKDWQNCRQHWWINIAYLQNFIWGDCMGHAWYLANDFQFYVFAPAFIIPLYMFPKVGIPFLIAGIAGSMVSHGVILSKKAFDFFLDVYIPPWTRFGAYGIGMFLGYALYTTKCKVKMHWALAVLGWIVGTLLVCVALFLRVDDFHWEFQKFCMTVQRPFFSLGISWVIFACCNGYGGPVNSFLSWKIFGPLGRLTYTGYLLHPLIMYYYIYYRYRPFYIQDSTMAMLFGGYTFFTIIFSFLLSLMFEIPALNLEKIFLPHRKKD